VEDCPRPPLRVSAESDVAVTEVARENSEIDFCYQENSETNESTSQVLSPIDIAEENQANEDEISPLLLPDSITNADQREKCLQAAELRRSSLVNPPIKTALLDEDDGSYEIVGVVFKYNT